MNIILIDSNVFLVMFLIDDTCTCDYTCKYLHLLPGACELIRWMTKRCKSIIIFV